MTDAFPVLDESTAPEAARDTLAAVREEFGMIPNLEGVMAQAPALLQGYAALWTLFSSTSLSPAERQVVYMTANFENDCDYCIAWHSRLASNARIPADEVERLRAGDRLNDPKLAALQEFTRTLIQRRGNPVRAELDRFIAAGYTSRHALEIVLGLAVKTMSNYTNGLAATPLDAAVESLRWERPSVRSGN